MKVKHSKYKNTGILFELLVKQITADTLKGKDSPAINILKNYFVKTELSKEYKLYETLLKSSQLDQNKANIFISTILESSKKLNSSFLKKAKYNLIKEIKTHYNLDYFFGSKIKNYPIYASIYTLIENENSSEINDSKQIIDNKITLLEHISKTPIDVNILENDVLTEFRAYDKGLRTLTYKIILEKFNDKYQTLNSNQREVLKEFISSIDSTPKLRTFYNNKINSIKEELKLENDKIKDKAIKIKINEISKFLVELDKQCKINNEHLVDLLQYYELLEEVKDANKT